MERLTERDGLIVRSKFKGDFASQNILHRLAEYEQAEEDGLLIKLPCRVGDVVYYFSNVGNVKHVEELKIYRLSSLVLLMEDEFFGKTVFLTKAEAEQALAKMKGE